MQIQEYKNTKMPNLKILILNFEENWLTGDWTNEGGEKMQMEAKSWEIQYPSALFLSNYLQN